jgi:hypothetical protein
MTIDLHNLPQHITLAVGKRTEFPLPSYAGSGNAWSATCLSGQEVARVSVELGEPPPTASPIVDGTTEPPSTAYAEEKVVVEGLTEGRATWQLVLARSFGPPEPTATHQFQVNVVGGP